MTYLQKKEKQDYLLYLIKKGRLSSLIKIANDYECSVRTVKRMIFNLRTEGHTIIYCRKSKFYKFYHLKNSLKKS